MRFHIFLTEKLTGWLVPYWDANQFGWSDPSDGCECWYFQLTEWLLVVVHLMG